MAIIQNTNSPFSHKSNNTIPTGSDVNNASGPTIDIQPNMLDNYDMYTYHWKFFMTSSEDSYSGNVLEPQNQIIIAESGVSDLTIDHVELQGIAIPSSECGTGTQTLVKFEIVEPSGAGLFDKMFYESISLGIGNWVVTPYYLQLEFRGRDPDTSQSVTSGAPAGLGSQRWVWPIKLTDAKANVTTVGTRYEFTAIIYNELAQSNAYFSLQHNVVLNGLTNFKKAMQDLEDKLNADQLEKLIDNYSIPDTYKIIVDPILENALITPAKHNTDTSRAGDYLDFNTKSASYNAGTSIDRIIDSLLGNTDYFQQKMQGSDTPTSKPGTNSSVPEQMKKLWRVITETRPIKFDKLRQNNANEITIFVIEYDKGNMDVNPSQTGQTQNAVAAEKNRLAEYIKKSILKKLYNYIFTGLNDQVITFDLTLNASFAAAMARFGGIYYDTATSDKGAVNQRNAQKEKELGEQVRKTIQFANDSTRTPAEQDAQINLTKQNIASSELDEDTKNRYKVLLDHTKPADRTALFKKAQSTGGINNNGTFDSSLTQAKSLTTPIGENLPSFISDVNLTSTSTQETLKSAIVSGKGKLRPVPYQESPQETNLNYGIDPSSDAGRNRIASVFSTALYSGLDASLQSIKMTIKGDPFWLFPGSLRSGSTKLVYNSDIAASQGVNAAIDNIKNSHLNDPNSVNIYATDNFVIIRFRTPRIFNETTGVTDPFTEVETFSGIYQVTRVTSKFEVGKFFQELECIIDPVITPSTFLTEIKNAVESSVKKGDILKGSNTEVSPLSDFSKTQRIAGPDSISTSNPNSISIGNNLPTSNVPSLPNFNSIV